MRVGLFFGTFNPIHIGHIILANHMVEYTDDLDEIWLVITPMSPFKQKKTLLDNHHRLAIADIAVEEYPKIKTCTIEFGLPQPNYTIDTLVHLEEKYPQHQFSLLMGEDNLKGFHKWKNYEVILDNYSIYVYPRISEGKIISDFINHPKIQRIKAPIVEISSTFIRKGIKEKKNIKPMLQKEVWNYIDEMNFYKK